MYQKIVFTLVLLTAVSLGAFAQGAVEAQMPETAEAAAEDSVVELRETGITGSLSLFGRQAVLESDDARYLLQYHRGLAADIDVDPETEVTVYGYVLPGELPDSGMQRMKVSRAVIDGESYALGVTSPEGVLSFPTEAAASQYFGHHHSGRGFGRWGEQAHAPAYGALEECPAFSSSLGQESAVPMHHRGWGGYQEPAEAGGRSGIRNPWNTEQSSQELQNQMHRRWDSRR